MAKRDLKLTTTEEIAVNGSRNTFRRALADAQAFVNQAAAAHAAELQAIISVHGVALPKGTQVNLIKGIDGIPHLVWEEPTPSPSTPNAPSNTKASKLKK